MSAQAHDVGVTPAASHSGKNVKAAAVCAYAGGIGELDLALKQWGGGGASGTATGRPPSQGRAHLHPGTH